MRPRGHNRQKMTLFKEDNVVDFTQILELIGDQHARGSSQELDHDFIENVLANMRINRGQGIIHQNSEVKN